jgi:hypothetical protein
MIKNSSSVLSCQIRSLVLRQQQRQQPQQVLTDITTTPQRSLATKGVVTFQLLQPTDSLTLSAQPKYSPLIGPSDR